MQTDTKYEIIQIDDKEVTFDVSQLASNKSVYINATEVGKQFGKKPAYWLKNDDTKEYVDALSRVENIPHGDLIRVKQGGTHQGTWLHSDLAVPYMRWLNPVFAVKCDKKIKELMTSQTSLPFGDMQPFMMEMLKSNQETTKAVVEMGNIIINLNNNLTKLKTEVKEDMERISHNIGSVAVVTSAANRTCENVMSQNMEVLEVVNKLEIYYRKDGLTSEQKKLIREKIRQRAEYYSKQFKMKANDLEPLIYIKLRDRFDVKIYDEIKSEQFPMALRFLDSIPFTYEDMGE